MPNQKKKRGITRLVSLPNKNTSMPARYAPKVRRRFLGGILGWEV
jgi:hypothetical protein